MRERVVAVTRADPPLPQLHRHRRVDAGDQAGRADPRPPAPQPGDVVARDPPHFRLVVEFDQPRQGHAQGVGQLAQGGDRRIGLRLLDLHEHALAEIRARAPVRPASSRASRARRAGSWRARPRRGGDRSCGHYIELCDHFDIMCRRDSGSALRRRRRARAAARFRGVRAGHRRPVERPERRAVRRLAAGRRGADPRGRSGGTARARGRLAGRLSRVRRQAPAHGLVGGGAVAARGRSRACPA